MKTLLPLLLLIITLFRVSAYEPLPPELDGTMMPYDFSVSDSLTPWGDTDLRPIGSAYIARHGARYLSSEKKVKKLREAVAQSRESAGLTADGEAFANLLDTVIARSRGHWGELTLIGNEEEARLGASYCETFPELSVKLKGKAVSSYVPRVVKTMWDFLYPLAANSAANDLTSAEGPRFSPLVRFFDTDTTYRDYIRNGDWKEVYDQFEAEQLPYGPARRLFGDIADEAALRSLTLDLYGVLQSLRATGMPAPTTRWMSVDEYRRCWEVSNLRHYLQRSLCSLSSEAMTATIPLLSDIMRKTEAIAAGEADTNANFWFGHAETLLPLSALMNLPGCCALPLDLTQLSTEWKDFEISPLGANILIALLKNPETNTPHIAVRLNGRWIEPLKGEGLMPLWKDVREYWEHRIEVFSPSSSL